MYSPTLVGIDCSAAGGGVCGRDGAGGLRRSTGGSPEPTSPGAERRGRGGVPQPVPAALAAEGVPGAEACGSPPVSSPPRNRAWAGDARAARSCRRCSTLRACAAYTDPPTPGPGVAASTTTVEDTSTSRSESSLTRSAWGSCQLLLQCLPENIAELLGGACRARQALDGEPVRESIGRAGLSQEVDISKQGQDARRSAARRRRSRWRRTPDQRSRRPASCVRPSPWGETSPWVSRRHG